LYLGKVKKNKKLRKTKNIRKILTTEAKQLGIKLNRQVKVTEKKAKTQHQINTYMQSDR